ncbi:hypothetical protein [Janthinobacterium violaceinigrum]|uniref:hypothetical protein n=1 Tax=Janthinobacterium violaceinigrum TaxID=2654252 RepID=UPI00386013A3
METSRLRLEAGADANVPNDQGQTPLAGVADKGYLDIAELLLQHGCPHRRCGQPQHERRLAGQIHECAGDSGTAGRLGADDVADAGIATAAR